MFPGESAGDAAAAIDLADAATIVFADCSGIAAMLDLAALSSAELDRLAASVASERARRSVPSADDAMAPAVVPSRAGDHACDLFRTAFRWEMAERPHEALTGDGRRVLIRARTVAALREPGTFAALRSVDEGAFDLLACIALDGRFRVLGAVLLTRDEVESRVAPDPLTDGWELSFAAAFRLGFGAFDVTARLAALPAPVAAPARRRRVRSATLRTQLAQSLELIER